MVMRTLTSNDFLPICGHNSRVSRPKQNIYALACCPTELVTCRLLAVSIYGQTEIIYLSE